MRRRSAERFICEKGKKIVAKRSKEAFRVRYTKKIIPTIIAIFLIAAVIVSIAVLASHASKDESESAESNVKDTQMLSAENQTDVDIKESSGTAPIDTETIEKIDLMGMAV